MDIHARILRKILADQIQQYIKKIIWYEVEIYQYCKNISIFTSPLIQHTTFKKGRMKNT